MSNLESSWQDRYVVKQHGYDVWAVYSARWHSVSPMKRISPYFSFKSEAIEWIENKWKAHIDNKIERLLLR